jgi:hypothetical protein
MYVLENVVNLLGLDYGGLNKCVIQDMQIYIIRDIQETDSLFALRNVKIWDIKITTEHASLLNCHFIV